MQAVVIGLLDLIYPPRCLICDSFQPHYLCPKCVEKISMLGPHVCRRCGAPVDQASCRECLGRDLYFDSVRSVAAYEDPLKEAIHLLKFSGHSCLIPQLGQLMVEFYVNDPQGYAMRHTDAVVAVPIDRARRRERGFNQSELLAAHLAGAAKQRVTEGALVRVRKAPPQSNLSYEDRLTNVDGVFAVASPGAIVGKKLLLIDDVYTTGSTVNEAAKVLKEAGAAEVHVFTLARSV